MSYRVRDARIADIPAITEIYALEVARGKASFELVPPDEAEMTRRLERIRDAGYSYLVACRGDDVLGYAYTSEYRSRPGYRFTVEDSVYVGVDARGCGIGTTLLTALIDDCRGKPFRQMIAVIGDSANQSSIRLHERTGFKHAGVLRDVGYKFGQWIDTVLMQRALLGDAEPRTRPHDAGNASQR
jgi:phosphinothricin acetyltransferase